MSDNNLKSKLTFITFFLLFSIISSYRTEKVIAEYDPETQTLIYNGTLFIVSPSPTESIILKEKAAKSESSEKLSGAEF